MSKNLDWRPTTALEDKLVSVPTVAPKAMIEYEKYRKFQKVVMEVAFLSSPKNVKLLLHTDPEAGKLDSISWRYADYHDMNKKFGISVEHTNHGDSQLGQQPSAALNNLFGPTTSIARDNTHLSYSKSDLNKNSKTSLNQHHYLSTQPTTANVQPFHAMKTSVQGYHENKRAHFLPGQ